MTLPPEPVENDTPRDGEGRLAVVLGLGRFGGGRAAARYLATHGYRVRVVDKAPAESLVESVAALADLDVDLRLGTGDDPAALEATLDDAALLIVNPAIPPSHPLLAAATARGLEVDQEIGLFLADYPGRVVLVTGTNGKSSTATLLHRALHTAGVDTLLGGNIGHSLLDDTSRWMDRDQVAVVEISSFQLERLDPARHPVDGAVFTPVTRDHLDRHGTLASYHAAKSRAAAAARRFVVHQADDPIASGFSTSAPLRLRHAPLDQHGPEDLAAWGDPVGWQWLAGAPQPTFHRSALRVQGDFQAANARAALLAAVHGFDADPARAALGLVTTAPLPYRLQQLGSLGALRVFDNGVSTAVESTVSALRGLPGPVHWVGGGKSKEGPEALPAQAAELAPYLATAHLFGAVAEDLAAALRRLDLEVTVDERLEDACARAATAAGHGRRTATLLFSPAFASFDQWPNFRARAEAFRGWFRQRLGEHRG